MPSGIFDVRSDGTVMVSGLPIKGWDGAMEMKKAPFGADSFQQGSISHS